MLPQHVSTLAWNSFHSELMPRLQAFDRQFRRIMAEAAANGITPTIDIFMNAVTEEVAARSELATQQLMRAGENGGLQYYENLDRELCEELQRITERAFDDISARCHDGLSASSDPDASIYLFDVVLRNCISTGVASGWADLHQYAQSLRTKRTAGRHSWLNKAFFVVLGVIGTVIAQQLPGWFSAVAGQLSKHR